MSIRNIASQPTPAQSWSEKWKDMIGQQVVTTEAFRGTAVACGVGTVGTLLGYGIGALGRIQVAAGVWVELPLDCLRPLAPLEQLAREA
jgi:hypothetical protein